MEYEYFVTELKFGIASSRQTERILNGDVVDMKGWEFVCFTPAGHGVYRREK